MGVLDIKVYKKSLEIILKDIEIASMEYVGLCGFSKHLYFTGKLTLSEFLQFNLHIANYAKKQHYRIKMEFFSNTGEYIPCITTFIWKFGDWKSREELVTKELIKVNTILEILENENIN